MALKQELNLQIDLDHVEKESTGVWITQKQEKKEETLTIYFYVLSANQKVYSQNEQENQDLFLVY